MDKPVERAAQDTMVGTTERAAMLAPRYAEIATFMRTGLVVDDPVRSVIVNSNAIENYGHEFALVSPRECEFSVTPAVQYPAPFVIIQGIGHGLFNPP